jgi:Ca2+-binding RTX toxin-like protein
MLGSRQAVEWLVAEIQGTDASETIEGTGDGDVIDGGGGNDTINGNDGDDTLQGGTGIDDVYGDAGNDTIYSSDGDAPGELGPIHEILDGGTGNDTFYISYASNYFDVEGGANYDTLYLNLDNILDMSHQTFVYGMTFRAHVTGVEHILITTGSASNIQGSNWAGVTWDITGGHDVATGDGDDRVQGATGEIDTFGGNDYVLGGTFVLAGEGNDYVEATDTIYGEGGNDRLKGAMYMDGGSGDDVFVVDDEDAVVVEGLDGGIDEVRTALTFTLPPNVERLELLGTGAITGKGNELDNIIWGNDAANVLNGLGGADTLKGGLGDDIYLVDNTGDVVFESSAAGGFDTVKAGVTYFLPGGVEKLLLSGSDAIDGHGNSLANTLVGNAAANDLHGAGGADMLTGGDGNDRLYGDQGHDTLNGGTGKDILDGGAGNDSLSGGKGDDILDGGVGSDTLKGGAGQDILLFDDALGTGIDHIASFSVVDDTFQLDHDIFTAAGSAGQILGSAQFYAGTAAHDSDDRIIYDSHTGRIYYDPDGTGAEAKILFATVGAGIALTNADFFIVA